MAKEELLRLDNQLCFAVYAASKEIIRLYRPLLEELDLTYTQYIILMVLWENNLVSFKELGEKLYLDSGTLSPVLKKLETKGVVLRRRSTDDERQVLLELTDKGRELKEKALQIPEKMICRMQLPLTDLTGLRDELKCLLARLPQQE